MVKETQRPKPSVIDVSEELGFTQLRLPEIGPGLHKPNMGRGGVPLPSEEYYGLEMEFPTRKGMGIGERVKSSPKKDTDKPKWSDIF